MSLEIAKSILDAIVQSATARLALQSEAEQTVFQELVRDASPLVASRLVGALPEGHPVLSESLMSKFTPQVLTSLPIASVQSVFARLSVSQQHASLVGLFDMDSDRYDACMSVNRLRWVRVGHRFIERVKSADFTETMAQRLVTQLIAPSVSVVDLAAVCNRMLDEFEWGDVALVLTQSLTYFLDQVVAIRSADDLKSVLKANWILSQFPFGIPESVAAPIVFRTIEGLAQMPSSDWVLKLLNQFDVGSIKRIVYRADADQLHRDTSRRNSALKVMNALRELVDMPEFKTVRFALDPESQ